MTKTITDTQLKEYLGKVRKPELVAWLLKQCENNPELRAALLDLATPKEDAQALAPEIRSRMRQAWQLSNGRDSWKMALPISQQLEQVLGSIEGLMDKGCLDEAEKLLVDFVAATEGGMAHIDDSYGHLWPVCQEGVTLWGKVWARIQPRDARHLADFVYDHIHCNEYSVKDDMITKFAGALGPEGLHLLQWRLRGDLASVPVANPDGPRWKQDYERRCAVTWLKEIADALGDVDEYVSIVESEQQTSTYALAISRRLYEAGRAAEALVYLERANERFLQGEPYDYATLKSKILIATGKQGEAREVLWQKFAQTLSTFVLDQILEMTPPEQQSEGRQRAVNLAQSHSSPEDAAHFLVEMKELKLAAQLIEQHRDQISGSNYVTLAAVAKALADGYPAQAWVIYRALLLDILDEGRYNAYGHAAKYFAHMKKLAEQADIASEQAEFEQIIRQKHGRKSSFWAKVNPT